MRIRWEHSKENNLWSLYIADQFMGVFDRYDYDKQRAIITALQAETTRIITEMTQARLKNS